LNSHCKQLRTLVVDDEPLARDALIALLEADADIASIEEAADVDEALRKVRVTDPQLIFLDVKMPGGDGFSLLQHLESEAAPAVVFVTAFADFAVPAFDGNAVDYLLKPVTRERFQQALARAKVRIETTHCEPGRTRADRPRYLQRIAVRVGEGVRLIRTQEVERFEAQENYVRVYAERKEFLMYATLSRLVDNLDPESFVRIHRSAVVRIDSIREVHALAAGEYVLTLASGVQVRTGRTYRDTIRSLLSNFT
jgi:two-component system LytT family response regulator